MLCQELLAEPFGRGHIATLEGGEGLLQRRWSCRRHTGHSKRVPTLPVLAPLRGKDPGANVATCPDRPLIIMVNMELNGPFWGGSSEVCRGGGAALALGSTNSDGAARRLSPFTNPPIDSLTKGTRRPSVRCGSFPRLNFWRGCRRRRPAPYAQQDAKIAL